LRSTWIAVGGLTLLAIVLRFVGLDAKGFWQDEAATVLLTRLDLGGMLSELIKGEVEATPPLYFLLAQGWSRVFGDGEVGIRSLSVLVGAATVPVAYLAARELVSRRAGIVAAALVAVNPLLIWYSQEARAYALMVLLSSLALLFFARALHDPRPRWFGLWSLSSVLALATHYVAVFLFLGQAAWLLATLGRRRSVLIASGTVVAAGAALLLLAVEQTDQLRQESFISQSSLVSRVVQLPGFFLVGFEAPYPLVLGLAAIAALFVGVGLVLLVKRTTPGERKGALVALSVGVVGIAGPLTTVVIGIDFFLYKYVLGALIPLAIGVAAGLTAARGGALGYGAAAGLVVLSLGIVIGTASEPKYQRESWREAAGALGDSQRNRAIVVTPGDKGRPPLRIYLPEARELAAPEASVAEIDVLALRQRELGAIATPRLPEVTDPAAYPPSGYRLVEQREDAYFLLFRYRSSKTRTLSQEQLLSSALDTRERANPIVLVEPAGEGA
jgi:4-amino-4-deoxy-L-arabinose transferase-like glycosyltransferase